MNDYKLKKTLHNDYFIYIAFIFSENIQYHSIFFRKKLMNKVFQNMIIIHIFIYLFTVR